MTRWGTLFLHFERPREGGRHLRVLSSGSGGIQGGEVQQTEGGARIENRRRCQKRKRIFREKPAKSGETSNSSWRVFYSISSEGTPVRVGRDREVGCQGRRTSNARGKRHRTRSLKKDRSWGSFKFTEGRTLGSG